ncbi:MAG: hypothetical protein JNM89_01790 [Hyphomicrobiaceae bacterium]|nr:hypothetical protein [Hyphomicrobiaceae bacterium]
MITLKAFDPAMLALVAALNPAVIAVAFWMGLKADQWQKLIVAALAAALAGFLLYLACVLLGIIRMEGIGGEAGIVALQSVFGLGWATAGFALARFRAGR